MDRTGGVPRWLLGVALLVTLMLIWWLRDRRPTPTPTPAAIAADCQQDSVLIVYYTDSLRTTVDTATAADMPLTQRIANLPEYHDCQRMVVTPARDPQAPATRHTFGPLVAIWAADSLALRFPGASLDQPPARMASEAVPIATVYTWDSTAGYAPLGIRPGFNCLYLWHDGAPVPRWRAAMVKRWEGPKGCGESLDPERVNGTPLQVETVPLPDGLLPSDIPQVTRWDWDSTTAQQYIDIRCGDQWCQVGPPGFKPTGIQLPAGLTESTIQSLPDITDRSATTGEIRRAFLLKGWSDEQQLDLPGATPSQPVLTSTIGTAFPHPTLDRATFDSGAWTTVGYLAVTEDYDGATRLERGISRLQLCQGTAEQCRAPAGISCTAKDQDPAHPWWGRTISQAGTVSEVRCVKRRDHGGRAIPAAAARWNWNELDAKTWAACGGGCCVVN